MKTCKKCGFQHNKDKCPECQKAYMAEWRAKNKERLEAYGKQYYATVGKPKNKERYAKNRDKFIARRRQYHKENGAKSRATSARWKKGNAERLREYEANRYATKTEYMKAKNKAWRARNPERRAAHEAKRRTQMRESGEKIDYAAIAKRDGYVCHICGLPVSEDELSFDHVIPLAKSGSHTTDNIKVAHKRCNSRKKDKIINIQKGEQT